ncbi:MAG: protein-glutamate O-methyltransferase CheR [Sphingomonas fennica]
MSAAALPRPRGQEFAFTAEDHRAVAAIVYDTVGILLPAQKMQLVYGRLAPRVRAVGLATVADYLTLIARDPAERGRMIDALTTNHTSFFREAHHFDDFRSRLWPALSHRLAAGGRVRLWSAACSSGEEPYTWLMSALGSDRAAAQRLLRGDLRLLATDVSPSVIETARAGRYPPDVLKTIPGPLRAAWVGRDGTVDPLLRQAIAFRALNLLGDWPMKGPFDAICCRNVMIYFDEPTKARLQARLADLLVPGGMLYIGHSERLADALAPRFRLVDRTAFLKVAA